MKPFYSQFHSIKGTYSLARQLNTQFSGYRYILWLSHYVREQAGLMSNYFKAVPGLVDKADLQ